LSFVFQVNFFRGVHLFILLRTHVFIGNFVGSFGSLYGFYLAELM